MTKTSAEFAIHLPQPWAYLLVTGQVNCVPGSNTKPPKDAVGKRVAIVAEGPDLNVAQSLMVQFPQISYPTVKRPTKLSFGLWRPNLNEPPGKMKVTKRNEWQEVREFISNPKYGLSEVEHVEFSTGRIGSALLAGWLLWEDGSKKPTAQYKAPSLRKGRMRVHKVAHGPLTWIFQRVAKKPLLGGTQLRPYERKG